MTTFANQTFLPAASYFNSRNTEWLLWRSGSRKLSLFVTEAGADSSRSLKHGNFTVFDTKPLLNTMEFKVNDLYVLPCIIYQIMSNLTHVRNTFNWYDYVHILLWWVVVALLVCIAKLFMNTQRRYFKKPMPAEHLWSILWVGVSAWDQCPVSPHHMISLTVTINHPVRLKLQGLICCSSRVAQIFRWLLKAGRVKTNKRNPRIYNCHSVNWSKMPRSSACILKALMHQLKLITMSASSLQERAMQMRERHLHTLSIKFSGA